MQKNYYILFLIGTWNLVIVSYNFTLLNSDNSWDIFNLILI